MAGDRSRPRRALRGCAGKGPTPVQGTSSPGALRASCCYQKTALRSAASGRWPPSLCRWGRPSGGLAVVVRRRGQPGNIPKQGGFAVCRKPW